MGGAGSAGEPLSAPTSAPASEAAPAPASSAGSPAAAPVRAERPGREHPAAAAPSAAPSTPVASAPAGGPGSERPGSGPSRERPGSERPGARAGPGRLAGPAEPRWPRDHQAPGPGGRRSGRRRRAHLGRPPGAPPPQVRVTVNRRPPGPLRAAVAQFGRPFPAVSGATIPSQAGDERGHARPWPHPAARAAATGGKTRSPSPACAGSSDRLPPHAAPTRNCRPSGHFCPSAVPYGTAPEPAPGQRPPARIMAKARLPGAATRFPVVIQTVIVASRTSLVIGRA